jgi:hypothetical protein
MARGSAKAGRELLAVEAAWWTKSAEVSKKELKKGWAAQGAVGLFLVDAHITQRSRAAMRMARSGRSSEQGEKWREG